MTNTLIMLIVFLVVLAGFIGLQILLSRSGKWLGLVLPLICFITSIISVLNLANVGDMYATFKMAVTVFAVYNVPTLVLLAIYIACRKKQKRSKEIERMNIQDL